MTTPQTAAPVPVLVTIAGQIAAALGTGWDVETPEAGETHYVHVTHTDGRRFYINSSQHTGMLHVSGCYPKDGERYMTPRDWGALSYNETAPSINCSTSRPPHVIAADIARRFLARYSPLYAACVAKQEATAAYRAGVANMARELAALIPGAKLSGEPDSQYVSFYNDTRGYGDITPYSDSVNMKLSNLSPALARKIAALIGATIKGTK